MSTATVPRQRSERGNPIKRVPLSPLGWEGFRIGPESGLTKLEVEALRRTGQLERRG